MIRRWLYGIDGRPTSIESKEIEAYLNSDKAGKEYKVAQLFAYNSLMTKTLNEMALEVQRLRVELNELKLKTKGE